MNTQGIFSRVQSFESYGRVLVSWAVGGYSRGTTDSVRDWQFESCAIATIAEAEDFSAKLADAIAGAKVRQAKIDAFNAQVETGQTTEEQPL